jgi:tRNA threonylcarbamoyladenosine biosynthesis protein TsaE
MATSISHSPTETAALGEQWGRAAESGLVIGLSGDLGAGKTQLVKGLARGLGITALVHSPTFALVNIYNGGRLTLFHLDLYRLDTPEQFTAAGLEDYLNPAGVTVIEWAERWFGRVLSLESKVRSPELPVSSDQSPVISHQSLITVYESPPPLRRVQFEVLSETERRISYEDSGA